MVDTAALEAQLDSFDAASRREALDALADAAAQGSIELPPPQPRVNLHGHTFFSYNALGYSPSRFAWEGRKAGLSMVGTVDFDVLDAMEEIHAAGDRLNLPATAGLETRVFVEPFADKELSSPGEPGIAYFMGIGFARTPQTEPGQATLQSMRDRADARNRAMLERVNAFLDYVQIDYDKDVLPLTPAGNATERHMLEAFEARSHEIFADRPDAAAEFWAGKLNMPRELLGAFLADSNAFRDTLRSKLMKRGGVGYVAPARDTFPGIEEVVAMIRSAGAIPTITWLDGASNGETDAAAMLETFVGLGCEALNIIPDRNWCITDPVEKETKIAKLEEIVALCRAHHLPVIVGTEMNKAGQKFVDDFDAPELASVVDAFLAGADFLYGHTLLERACAHGRMSDWAAAAFASREEAVAFYSELGRAAGAPKEALEELRTLPEDHDAQAVHDLFA
ncbi:MAG: hypothetical protein ACOCX4_06175 [Planctomycetota bacterium]